MNLTQLRIHQLRNIESATLNLNPRYNILTGINGSGKTTVLEAIYLLSTCHSFRTREITPLIMHDRDILNVFARVEEEQTISVQKSINEPAIVKINQETCKSNSKLSQLFPCQVFHQDIFQIIDAGPAVRRNVLDWGLFHVEHTYHQIWKDYKRVLKQRNALLKQTQNYADFAPWDEQLALLADKLDELRLKYFGAWSMQFQSIVQQLSDIPCVISYYKGWGGKNLERGLQSILEEQFSSDLRRQYTQSGAHQADIIIDTPFLKAKQTLSRGQQKIILISLKLAQAALLDRLCWYLFDDVSAELDRTHLNRLLQLLHEIPGQFFLTTIDEGLFYDNPVGGTWFDIHLGQIVPRETLGV